MVVCGADKIKVVPTPKKEEVKAAEVKKTSATTPKSKKGTKKE